MRTTLTYKMMMVVIVLALAQLACGGSSSKPSVVSTSIAKPTIARTPPKGTTPASANATKTPTPGTSNTTVPDLKLVWSIKIGEIDHLGVAQDGTIYGLTSSKGGIRYVVIASDGQVKKTIDMPKAENMCGAADFNPHIISGLGRAWFNVMPDGMIVCSVAQPDFLFIAPDGTTRVLNAAEAVGGPPYLGAAISLYNQAIYVRDAPGVTSGNTLYYLNLSGKLEKRVEFPPVVINDQEWGTGTPFYTSDKGITFYNAKGEIAYTGVPDGLEIKRGFEHYMTYWGDLWLFYTAYDKVGNKIGSKVARIDANGQVKYFEKMPIDLKTGRVMYLPNKNEIYYLTANLYFQLNRDLQTVAQHTFPSQAKNTFIGLDGAAYDWSGDTLSKYTR